MRHDSNHTATSRAHVMDNGIFCAQRRLLIDGRSLRATFRAIETENDTANETGTG
jgi:hypothetical protein